MGYGTKYYIPFTSLEGVQYAVVLNKKGYEGSALFLDGGPSPFVSTLDDDDNLVAPLRLSTAQINYIDDVKVTDLLPESADDWIVGLAEVDNIDLDNPLNTTYVSVLWQGYLVPGVYTQPNVEGPNIVTINAQSLMSMAKNKTMDNIMGLGTISIGRIIFDAMEAAQLEANVYWPRCFVVDGDMADSALNILTCQLSTALYIDFPDHVYEGEDEYEIETYGKALEDICTFLGLTMVDTGEGDIYFVRPGYRGQYTRLPKGALLSPSSALYDRANAPLMLTSNLTPADDSNTISIAQGAPRIEIKPQLKSNEIDSPDISDAISYADTKKGTSTSGTNTGNLKSRYYAVLYTQSLLQSRVSLNMFTPRVNGYDSTGRPTYVTWLPSDNISNEEYTPGAIAMRLDTVDPNTLTSDNPKRAWSLEDVVSICDETMVRSGNNWYFVPMPQYIPILRSRSQTGAIKTGAIVIDFSLMASPRIGFWMPKDYTVACDAGSAMDVVSAVELTPWKDINDNGGVLCSLRIGNRYYDGTEWVDDFSQFRIPIKYESSKDEKWHGVETNKNIDMPYDGSSGYYVEINETVSGPVEFVVYPCFSKERDYTVPQISASGLCRLFYLFKGLKLKYEPRIDDSVSSSEDDVVFARSLDNGYENDVNVSLEVHSKLNEACPQSLMLLPDTSPLDTMTDTTTDLTKKPEELLLDRYAEIYKAPHRSYVYSTPFSEITPQTVFADSTNDAAGYEMAGYEIDYVEDTMRLTLLEVPQIKDVN